MQRVILLFVACSALILAGCTGPEAVTVTVEVPVKQTVVVTQISEVTREVEVVVTEIVEVTQLVPVTITPSPTPPGPTSTPTTTPTPTSTPDLTQTQVSLDATATLEALGPLIAPKGDGFYLIGVDIAPGLWRSTGSGDQCYWARRNDSQRTLDNHYGLAGGTIRIQPSDFEVEFSGCGMFEYMGP